VFGSFCLYKIHAITGFSGDCRYFLISLILCINEVQWLCIVATALLSSLSLVLLGSPQSGRIFSATLLYNARGIMDLQPRTFVNLPDSIQFIIPCLSPRIGCKSRTPRSEKKVFGGKVQPNRLAA